MKKAQILFVLISCFLLSLQAVVIPEKMKEQLNRSVIKNLANLPEKFQKPYKQLLKQYPDGLMAFLIASEENGKLLIADPEILKQHYDWLIQHDYPENGSLSVNEYLSYIAKLTVSDERIEFYRDKMGQKELYEIREKYPDMMDRVRALNLWSKKYLTFESTSGRDLSPLDILYKTNVGRCEESQIIFVAAARCIGIPARPAFTPWWAHIDNNHAWAEVLINGKWYYLGACEPEYDLNRSWFTDLIDKAVLVVSEGAFPDPSEEVLIKGRYMSYINSTALYQTGEDRNRKITVHCKKNGKPVPEAIVQVMVYNWGSLRSLVGVRTDSLGSKTITTGQGALFLLADADSLFDLQFIPESTNDTMVVLNIDQNRFNEFQCRMTYPKPVQHKWNSSPEYEKERDRIHQAYADIIKQQNSIPLPADIPADSLIEVIWKKCRFNKDSFADFYRKNKPEKEFLSLINEFDKKYFYQVSEKQYELAYQLWKDIQKSGLMLEQDLKINILSQDTAYEELPMKRPPKSLLKWRKLTSQAKVKAISAWMKKKFNTSAPEKAIAGQFSFHYALQLDYLNDPQFRMLMVSLCRWNLLPADMVDLPGVIGVNIDNKWQYYNYIKDEFLNEENETEKPSTAGRIELSFSDENDQVIKMKENEILITVYDGGYFYTSENQPKLNSEGVYTAELQKGHYQLQVGYRLNGEETRYQLFPLDIKDQQVITKKIVLNDYPFEWQDLDKETERLISLVDSTFLNKDMIVLFGDFEREMIRRLYNKVEELNKADNCLWIGGTKALEAIKAYRQSPGYSDLLMADSSYKSRIITLYYNRTNRKWSCFTGMWDQLPK